MKVFISWSGERSRAVAILLKEWLECVLQSVKPFMSDDIARGSLWFTEIAGQLRETTIGVICLTLENRQAPWILFEAGALAKGLDKSRVCPLLVDLESGDVTGPLGQFNHSRPDKDGLEKLVRTLNAELGDSRLKDDVLRKVFEIYWPDFEKRFADVLAQQASPRSAEAPSNDDKIDDLVKVVRSLERRIESVSRVDQEVKPGPYMDALLRQLDLNRSGTLPEETRQTLLRAYFASERLFPIDPTKREKPNG